MIRAKDALIAALVLLLGQARPASPKPPERRIVAPGDPDPRAELWAIALLGLTSLCAIGFVVAYAFDRSTQLLGLALGLALAFLTAALLVIGFRLIVTEELSEDYPELEHRAAQDDVAEIVAEGGSRFTRGRLVKLAGVGAAGALGAALVTPALQLGPVLRTGELYRTPWRRGRRLVDANGRPYAADEIEEKAFYTAFPEGGDPAQIGAPVVVVRLAPSELHLPDGRGGWAPRGILAYSKICTHAGCALALYRVPTFPAVEPGPALVCPCHYSSFDVARGGTVIFGPAGRALPQLPLSVDARGDLRAAGNLSAPPGPSWWGVRMGEPHG